jgi:CHASE3 domain sensor protein
MRLGIRGKLLSGFGVMVVLIMLVGYVGISTAQGIYGNLEATGRETLPSIQALSSTQASVLRAQRDVRGAILVASQQETVDLLSRVETSLVASEKSWAAYKALPSVEAERQLWPEYDQTFKVWRELMGRVRTEAQKNTAEANQVARDMVLKETAPQAAKVSAVLDQLVQLNAESAEGEMVEARDSFRQSFQVLIGTIVAGSVVAAAIGLFLARGITRAVATVAQAAQQIAREDLPSFVRVAKALADGDLTQDATVRAQSVTVTSTDELGAMAADFNVMIVGLQETGSAFAEMSSNLRDVLGQVRASADGVADTSSQLGDAANRPAASSSRSPWPSRMSPVARPTPAARPTHPTRPSDSLGWRSTASRRGHLSRRARCRPFRRPPPRWPPASSRWPATPSVSPPPPSRPGPRPSLARRRSGRPSRA